MEPNESILNETNQVDMEDENIPEETSVFIEEQAPSSDVAVAKTKESESREDDPFNTARSAQELLAESVSVSEQSETLVAESEQGFRDAAVVRAEVGNTLGLSTEEQQAALNESGLTEREMSLRERLRDSMERFQSSVRRGAGVATTALVLGAASPSFAENPSAPLETLRPNETSTQVAEHVPLLSYEETKRQLHKSVLTAPGEERAIFVRTKDGEPMKTMIFKKGQSVSVGFTDEEYKQFQEAMRSNTAEIEDVHTHPLSAMEKLGLISEEKAGAIRRGEIPARSIEPSSQDWNMLFFHDSTYNFPPGQMSHRVIDPTGEWEYGVSDSNSAFITGMRKVLEGINGSGVSDLGLTPEEDQYLKDAVSENETIAHAMHKIMGSFDGVGDGVRQKFFQRIAPLMEKYVSAKDGQAYGELVQPLTARMNAEERNVRIQHMQEIASSLGFRLSYTPNSVKTPE